MSDELNSSDIDFGAPEVDKRKSTLGRASIEAIIANAASDRITSKRRAKQLQFGRGAPSTRNRQNLWVVRFEAFREHVLKQDVTVPFTEEDFLRFFDSIIDKMKPGGYGKTAVNVKSVMAGFEVIIQYGVFTWSESDGFKITSRDGERFRTFIDDAVKQGRLMKGHWYERTWLGFATLSRMVRVFLEHFIAKGCLSWDLIVAKCLSITLVAALGVRAGDVTLSNHYHNEEFLQWRHIRLYIDADAESTVADFNHLRAVVTLKFTKGAKDTYGEDFDYYLRPLEDADSHVCPIVWLLIHALRNGLVSGNTLSDVLGRALSRPDHTVEWTYPSHPVITAFTHDRPIRCDLAKPATPHRLLETIKEMGLISNILSRVYTHATRLGAIRDIAHLPPKTDEAFGFTTEEHRQIMHHSVNAMAKGVTERYVGEHTRELYNDRADNQAKQHRREPMFSSESAIDIVKAPVSQQEIQAWREENEGQQLRTVQIRRAIRQQRLETFRETAIPEDRWASSERHRPTRIALAERSASSINASPTVTGANPTVTGPSPTMTGPSPTMTGATGPLDPSILNDEGALQETEVPDIDLRLLESTIFRGGNQPNDSMTSPPAGHSNTLLVEEESDRLLLGVDDDRTIPMSAIGFVDQYSRINIVMNQYFASAWQAASLEKPSVADHHPSLWSMSGNSRDAPTPFVYHCQKTMGCLYESFFKGSLASHESLCSKSLVDKRRQPDSRDWKCPYEGCDKVYASKQTLKVHVDGFHEWVPKACEHGCDPATTYTTLPKYKFHIDMSHNARWPSPCRYPGCDNEATKTYSASALRRHLAMKHGVANGDQLQAYLPPNNPVQRFVPQTCPKGGCKRKTGVFNVKYELQKHLERGHGMSRDEAEAFIKEKAEFETIVNPVRRPPKRKGDSDDQE